MVDLTRARAIYYEALDTKAQVATLDRGDRGLVDALSYFAAAAARLTLAYMSTDPELARAVAAAVEHTEGPPLLPAEDPENELPREYRDPGPVPSRHPNGDDPHAPARPAA